MIWKSARKAEKQSKLDSGSGTTVR